MSYCTGGCGFYASGGSTYCSVCAKRFSRPDGPVFPGTSLSPTLTLLSGTTGSSTSASLSTAFIGGPVPPSLIPPIGLPEPPTSVGLQGSLDLGMGSAAAAVAVGAFGGGSIGRSDDPGGGGSLIPSTGDGDGGGGGGGGGGSMAAAAAPSAAAAAGAGGGVAAQKPKLKEGRCPFVGKDGVQCRTNTRLIQFSCQCGINGLCAIHRYADQHSCTHDYAEAQRKLLEKGMPAVRGTTLSKL